MSAENKALMTSWFEEVWNKGRADAIEEKLSADAVIHGLVDAQGKPVNGLQAFRDFHAQFRGAFPDIGVNVEDMVAEGDRVAARCTVHGNHFGDHLGFAATNAPVEFTGVAIIRVKDGKIAEAWNNFDFMKMNQQLGVL
jgi:steroid delta-isomerase-like uncharacterized protein